MKRPRSSTSRDIDHGSTAAHQRLVHDILIAFGARPGLRLWKNAVGRALSFDGLRVIQYGLTGSPDIIGVGPGGRFIGIEVKTGSAKQTPEQIAFAKAMNALGAQVFVARSVEDVETMLHNM